MLGGAAGIQPLNRGLELSTMSAPVPMLIEAAHAQSVTDNPPKLRVKFPEAWIFENLISRFFLFDF